jgi:hypothetical protein
VTAFTVHGHWLTMPVTLTWDTGNLTGDEGLVYALTLLAQDREGQEVGCPGGPFTTTHHLESPMSTLVLLLTLLDTDPPVTVTGDAPTQPTDPPGVIF